MKKRRFLPLITFVLLALMMSLPTWAAEGDFVISDGVLTKYTGSGGQVVIPQGVTTIGEMAFFGRSDVTGVTFPEGLTGLEYAAFFGCTGLTEVTLPGSVTHIGKSAFILCSGLSTVTIPDGVTEIGNSAFQACTGLTSVTIPDSVTTLGDYAFGECTGLTNVTIPNSVTAVGEGTFFKCTGLTNVVLSSRLTTIADAMFSECTSLDNVVIPEGVTVIGEKAFATCTALTGITLPNSLKQINYWGFYRCANLTNLVLPGGIKILGDYVFQECTNLTSVTVPSTLTSIGNWVFNHCDKLTLHLAPDSTAVQYAKDFSIPYVTDQPIVEEAPLAYRRSQLMNINGASKSCTAYARKDDQGNETNYVKLRELACLLNESEARFNVTWDGAVNIQTKTAYPPDGTEVYSVFGGDWPYTINTAPIQIDGMAVDLEAIVLTDVQGNGYTYFKLRDLGQALGVNVSWDSEAGMVVVDTTKPYSGS